MISPPIIEIKSLTIPPKKTYVGLGNPNAQILVVGQEGSSPEIKETEISTAQRWVDVIANDVEVNFQEDYSESPLLEGHTWVKYQKLHNYIFGQDYYPKKKNECNFLERFFTTEVNINRSPNNSKVLKDGMEYRKQIFFQHSFIQNFPIVILACGYYFQNTDSEKREIDSIFKVKYVNRKETDAPSENRDKKFWLHYDYPANPKKPIIHTRQLSESAGVIDELLKEITDAINQFISNRNIE